MLKRGGVVSSGSGYIGHDPNSTGIATVSGIGSQWNNFSGLFLGGSDTSDGGMGTLILADSGQVNVGNDLYSGADTALTVSAIDSSGNLWVRNGSTITNRYGYIGYSSNSTGVATVTGIGSQWNNSSRLYVGYSGNGTLNVEAGGVVSNKGGYIGYSAGSTGVATVTGIGSQWNYLWSLHVGSFGNGTLNVEAGGVVSGGEGGIGVYPGSTGEVTVTGIGSQWNCWRVLVVGSSGNGTLDIEAGGVVSSGDGCISFHDVSTSLATVTGIGSQWNNSGSLDVGYRGNGTLNVEAGGVISSGDGHIGGYPGSTGEVTVSGIGSLWNNLRHLRVGVSGNGTLNVEAGGVVGSALGYIGYNPNSMGVATVSGIGSQWNNSGHLRVGNLGHGTLNITDGGIVSVGGTLAVGSDSDVNDSINMSTGGMLALWGEAESSFAEFLDLIAGPAAIRYWDDDSSDWADIVGASYGADYTLSYLTEGDLTGYTLLTVGIAGDFNGNGVVDGNDFLLWQRDPSVGSLSAWETNYGRAAPLPAVTAAVPEPSSLALIAVGLLGVSCRRRRRA